MAATLPDDQRLIDISPKAYEHPADRAATAALQQIPMIDTVVRKLIEFGYERAFQQQLLADAVRLGDDQLPERLGSRTGRRWRGWTSSRCRTSTSRRCRSSTRWRSAPRSRWWCSTRGTVNAARRARAAHRARARGRRTSCPTTSCTATALMILLSIGAGPLLPLPFFAGPAAAGGQARAARVVPRRGAVLRPRGDARQPQPDDDLPDADGDGRRRGVAQAQPRRVRQAGQRVRRVGARLGQADPVQPRAADHAPYPVQARVRADEVGPLGRLRPDHERRVPQARRARPTRARRPATRPSTTRRSSGRSSSEVGEGVNKAGDKAGDAADKLSDWLKQR